MLIMLLAMIITILLLVCCKYVGSYHTFRSLSFHRIVSRPHSTFRSRLKQEFHPTDTYKKLKELDHEIINVATPAFFALAADPLASIVDAIFVGKLGPVQQAAMGISISAQYSIAKLYNDPLLKTSTSLVASQSGKDLEASVATSIATAIAIGSIQSLVFLLLGGPIMNLMGVTLASEMRKPALAYLRWRAIGVPAATVLLVANGIFRGRGDTRTPFYCTLLSSIINIVLDPFLIFTCKMGCAGAGAATAISQWVTLIPLLYLLNRVVSIKIAGRNLQFYRAALEAYSRAGGLLLLRTVAKIGAYAFTSSVAARMGPVAMAAYSVTFNLGFATSQLCESIAIASQALLARDFPFETRLKKLCVGHVVKRSLWFGLAISAILSTITYFQQDWIIHQLTKSPEVFNLAKELMPIVLITQLLKGLAYSTGGILLGGLDWFWSSLSMQLASVLSIATILVLPRSLYNVWIGLSVFMGVQVLVALFRLCRGEGPWKGIIYSCSHE